MRAALKHWRESSSLLLVAKTNFVPPVNGHQSDFNYKLLTVERSSKSASFPNAYAFPGGNMCAADKSLDWLELYRRFGFESDTFAKLDYQKTSSTTCLQDLPMFLSLRICAIRETFEECGILICRSYKLNYKERSARWAAVVDGEEIRKWQKSVHEDPLQFLQLCEAFEVYPDVWALKTWSNWLTPSNLPKHFDTMFFLAAFQQTPAAYADEREVQRLEWATPKEYILRNYRGEVPLPPPQFYEISRVGNFLDVEQLAKFASARAAQGVEGLMPVEYDTENGVCAVLPGDELYPASPKELEGRLKFAKLPESHVQHRMYRKVPLSLEIRMKNYTPKCGHISPAIFDDTNPSKL